MCARKTLCFLMRHQSHLITPSPRNFRRELPVHDIKPDFGIDILTAGNSSVEYATMKAFATAAICMGLLASSSLDGWAQISDDVVKIGVLDDMSGLYADIQGPGDVVAVKLAVEDFGGTVNGKPIEVVSGDLQNKADVGSAIARRWYDVEKVDVILGLGNSAVALAVQGISQEKNRVAITTAAGSTALTGKACAPLGIHWVYDTYALAKGTAR